MWVSTRMPLEYRISSWKQLPQCLSNNSRELSIKVTDFIQDDRISGLRIAVYHTTFGVLFATVLDAAGSMISTGYNRIVSEMKPESILSELAKFGFIIEYEPATKLKGDQIQYLMTLKNLHFDKIRLMDVYKQDDVTGTKSTQTFVVAFNVEKNSNWLNNDYSCSIVEFADALTNGSAMNITGISETRNYNWTWLSEFVANIDDIIRDNAEVTN